MLLIANTYIDAESYIDATVTSSLDGLNERVTHTDLRVDGDARRRTRMAHVQNLIINGAHSSSQFLYTTDTTNGDDILFNKGSMSRRNLIDDLIPSHRLSTLYMYSLGILLNRYAGYNERLIY